MNLRIPLFAVSSGLLLCLSCAISARAQGNTIRGKVRDSSGSHVARTTVTLESGTGAMISQTVTNNEGRLFLRWTPRDQLRNHHHGARLQSRL